MFKPTYLYIKIHNKTGLKYFGKTSSRDPLKYRGSGTRWLNHINYHGYDVSTDIIGYFTDEEECKKVALDFSAKNNITESLQWANIILEDGIGYGAGLEGIRNSQYGSYWVTDGTHNKKIKKTESIPPGWVKGRKVPEGWGNNIRNKLGGKTLEDILGIEKATKGRISRRKVKTEYHSSKRILASFDIKS